MSTESIGHVTHKSHKSLERDKPKHSRQHLGQAGIQPRKHGNTVLGDAISSEDGIDGADDPNDPNYDDPQDQVGQAADKPAQPNPNLHMTETASASSQAADLK